MTDLDRAIAAAREALKVKSHPLDSRVTKTLRDLLAALDAARGEAVAWVDVADAESGPYEFHGIEKLPAGKHHLFSAPPAALAVPEGVREAWQRLKPRLTPDRERVFAAITETLIRFGHDDATMLQDCIFAADAAIAAAVPASLTAELAARLDKVLGCHADSMPKEAYFEVDAVMRALQAQPPAAAVPAEVMLDALDEACKNSEGRRVSWYGYTRDQRIDVMRRAMLAAANKENNNG